MLLSVLWPDLRVIYKFWHQIFYAVPARFELELLQIGADRACEKSAGFFDPVLPNEKPVHQNSCEWRFPSATLFG
jgi:hypothetical protein